MLSFARDPQGFINDWLQSQCRDFKVSVFFLSLVILYWILLATADMQHKSLNDFELI